MKRRRPEGETLDCDTLSLVKAEVRSMVSKEVSIAVENSDKMMKALTEKIREIESEPRYDARMKKLEAHIKKIKRRGDAAFAYIRKFGTAEMLQNQQKSDASPTLLSVSDSSANGGCSGDSTSTSAEIDCEGGGVRKPKEGFWQSLRSKKQIVDLTDDDEVCRQNGKMHSESPEYPQLSVQKDASKGSTHEQLQNQSLVSEESKKSTADNQVTLLSKLPPFPDTPFPDQLPLAAASKNLPQKLVVKVARIDNPQGIALVWNVEEVDPHAPDMDCYYVYVIQEYHDGSFTKWKNMGVIKAMPLPMACRISDRAGGKTLYFMIVGKDIYGRYGPFSDIQTVVVRKS